MVGTSIMWQILLILVAEYTVTVVKNIITSVTNC